MIESITGCQDCYSHWTWFGFPPLRPPSLVGFPACGWLSSSRDPQTLHFRHSPLTSTASHRGGEKRKEMQHRVWICRKLSSRLSHNEDSCFEEAVTRVREEKNFGPMTCRRTVSATYTITYSFTERWREVAQFLYCYFASTQASQLKTLALERLCQHRGGKPHTCNQCDFVSRRASEKPHEDITE